MEEDYEKCSNPTQSTDDDEEAIMREETGCFMSQDQNKCNEAKNLKINYKYKIRNKNVRKLFYRPGPGCSKDD